MARLFCIGRGRSRPISDEEVESRIRELRQLGFSNFAEDGFSEARRTKTLMRGVIEILRDCSRSQLHLAGPREILFCVVKILLYYEDVAHSGEAATCDWKRRRDCALARGCYRDALRSFVPEQSARVVDCLVEVVHSQRLWYWDDLCWDLMLGLLEYGISGGPIAHALLDCVESSATGVRDARAIVRNLYEMLDAYSWPKSNETVRVVERLLKLYRASFGNFGAADDETLPRAHLRRGLEVCIRRTIEHLGNEHLRVVVYRMCSWTIDERSIDGTISLFGGILEYAAYMHETGLYRETFDENMFAVLMRMISSASRFVSLLGNRVIQYLLDRRGNRSRFDTPKIFFEGMGFDLEMNDYSREDKLFLQKKRKMLHDSLVTSMINHSTTRLNVESTYCTICLIAVEVPCGFTAAAIVCLAMNLQDVSFDQSETRREASYHIHAVVMAVMSLLCWIHEAKVFYTYVNKIMMERAQWAPHLNPPIKARYNLAVHHVLWNKPELFFVDWEARYGLWKCFRLRESRQRSRDESLRKKTRLSA